MSCPLMSCPLMSCSLTYVCTGTLVKLLVEVVVVCMAWGNGLLDNGDVLIRSG
jgi:hypothetical protein